MTAAGQPATDIVYEYQAKQTEDGPVIHSYALELVSHLCNNYHDISSIDKPIPKYNNNNDNNQQKTSLSFRQREESEQERLIRLELRHRFYSAKAVHMPAAVFAKKLVEDIWGGELIEEAKPLTTELEGQPEDQEEVEEAVVTTEISRTSSSDNSQTSEDEDDSDSSGTASEAGEEQEHLPSFEDNIHNMDVASAALQFMDDDDDHFLFSTDQLEEELNVANGEMMMLGSNHGTADDHTTAADTLPSLHTAHTMSTASTTSTSRSERAKRRRKPSPKALEIQQDQQEQEQSVSAGTAAAAAAPPALKSEPAAATATSAAAKTATKKKKSSAAPKVRKKKSTAKAKKKVEPLAEQAIPGHGRGARQKMFTWADRMVQLAEYKEKFGHIAIPTVRRDPYYNLGLWLAAQRSLYRKSALRKERLADLRNLGCLGFGGPGG